jgi:hypothetical protein
LRLCVPPKPLRLAHNSRARSQNPNPRPALKPLLKKSPTFLDAKPNPISPHLHRIRLQCISLPIHIPPVFQIKLKTMHRANDLAPTGNIRIHHRGARMRTSMCKAIPFFIKTRNTEFFSFDINLGDAARCPLKIGGRFSDLMPLVLLRTH